MTIATNINEMDSQARKENAVVLDDSKEQTQGSLINKNQDLHYLYKQAPIGIVLNILSALHSFSVKTALAAQTGWGMPIRPLWH